jgi:hypothetical protein
MYTSPPVVLFVPFFRFLTTRLHAHLAVLDLSFRFLTTRLHAHLAVLDLSFSRY